MPNTWKGVEANGRLRGTRTLFVGGPGNFTGYEHVYFNPWYLQDYGFREVLKIIDTCMVTVCVYPKFLQYIPEPIMKKARVVVCVPCPANLSKYLKPGDEVRLDFGSYLNASSQWETFSMARPGDYAGDEVIS